MSDKQPIDKLFKDKLSDFEATPNASVWDNISQQLDQGSDDRKVIPLWMKIVGIAAGVVLLISLGNAFFGSESDTAPEQEIVDSEENIPGQDNQENLVPSDNDDRSVPTAEEVDSGQSIQNEVADTDSQSDSTEPDPQQKPLNNRSSNQKNAVVQNDKLPLNASDALVKTENTVQKEVVEEDPSELPLQKDAGLAENIKSVDTDAQKKPEQEKSRGTDDMITKEADPVKNTGAATEKAVAEAETEDATQEEITDAVNENLEEAIAAQEESESDEKEELENRWGVTPQLAPVYFNSIGSGSAIDEEFAGNSKSGEINMNYGIVASYDFNEKLTLRAGINQMNVSYRTNDVIVYNNIQPNVDEKPLKNVTLNAESSDLSFISANGLNVAQVPGVVAANIESSIDQEIGFIEIPIELEYKLSNNKVGFSLIGGMSTLILNENRIYSSLQGNRTELGEASNINSTSFSANVGLGMNVKLSESIDLNLEPVFKYQLNTFKDTSGSFNPYALGVYTGLSFKF